MVEEDALARLRHEFNSWVNRALIQGSTVRPTRTHGIRLPRRGVCCVLVGILGARSKLELVDQAQGQQGVQETKLAETK